MTAVFEIPEPVVSPSGAGGGGGLRSQPVRIPLAAERQLEPATGKALQEPVCEADGPGKREGICWEGQSFCSKTGILKV